MITSRPMEVDNVQMEWGWFSDERKEEEQANYEDGQE